MKTKRFLSAFLAVMMLVSMMATGVYATDAVAKIGDTSYESLQAAISAAAPGDEIDLCSNVEQIPTITKAITIDGNNYHVTAKADGHQFGVINGTVTLKNLIYDNGTEAIRTDYGNYGAESADYENLNLVIVDCIFNDINGYAIMGGQSTTKMLKSLTVKNCEFNAGTACNNYMVYAQRVLELTVADCTFNGKGVTKGAIHTGDSEKTATVAKISYGKISGVERGIQIGNRVAGSNVSVEEVTFENITDAEGVKTGAIYVYDFATAPVSVSDSTFTNCKNVVSTNNSTEGFVSTIIKEFTGNTVDGKDAVLNTDGTVSATTAMLAKTMDVDGNVVGEYENFESALAAACTAGSGVARIEILGDITENAQNPDVTYKIAENQNLTIGVPENKEYTVDITRNGDTFSIYMMTSNSSLTIEEGLTIKGLDIVADGFATSNNELIINGTLYALSLKEWTSNYGITIGKTGKVVLGYGDGQLDFAYGNGYVTINGNGDKTEPQFKAGYSGTRGNGNTLNLNDTYFEAGAWLNVNGSNGTFNIDNSILKVSGGDSTGKLAITSKGNAFNLTNGSTLEVGNLTLGADNEITIDGTSQVKVNKLTGAGTIKIDVETLTPTSTPIVGDASDFTGEIELLNNDKGAKVKLENGKIVLVVPAGESFTGYTAENRIWGEVWGNAYESFVIKVLDADGNVMGTTSLNNVGGIINGNVKVTWNLLLDAASNTDEYWTMNWTTAPSLENVPSKVELWVDGVKVSGGNVVLNAPDSIRPVFAAKTDADGKILSYISRGISEDASTVLASSIAGGDNVAILVPGTYSVPTGKSVSITGAVDGVVFDNIGQCGLHASATFNNVIFDYYPNVNYTGLQHSNDVVYNDCTFNGQVFLYGNSETFNNCTFNQNSADAYNVWTYDAKKVKFDGCTFNSAGKSVLIYHEGATTFNDVEFIDCDLIASAPYEGKAAIEMDSSLTAGIKLTIDKDTTATGFGTGNNSDNSLWNNKKGDSGANNDITVIVDGETVLKPKIEVSTKAELDAAISNAADGDTILLTADLTYDGSRINIDKPIILNLNGYTITTNGKFGVIMADGGCSIVNGKIVYTGTNAVIKVKDVAEIKDLEIEATNTSGATIGGIVLQENCTGVDAIENVTIKGAGLTNGIETYNCGNATSPVIGSMKNVTIDSRGVGMNISAPCGTATDCNIKGDKTGIELWIKGTYSATLDLVNCTVEGGNQAAHIHDEYSSSDIENIGDLTLSADDTTTFTNTNGDVLVMTIVRAEDVAIDSALTGEIVAKNGDTSYTTFTRAVADAKDGDTITLISGDKVVDATATVCGKTITITGEAIFDWSKGWFYIGRGGEGDGKVIFENANIKSYAKKNVAAYGFNVSGSKASDNTTNNGTLVIKDSYIEVDHFIDRNSATIDNSRVTVYGGTYVHGRAASESASGKDETAILDLVNGSTLNVVNPNGEGVGDESFGVMNIDKTSTLTTQIALPVRANGTVNSSGSILGKGLTVADANTINISAGVYSFDPSNYLTSTKLTAYKANDNLWVVAPIYTVEAVASKPEVQAGEEFTVSIKVNGGDYTNAGWKLSYDATKFEYVKGTNDPSESNYAIVDSLLGEGSGLTGDDYTEGVAYKTYKFRALYPTEEVTGTFTLSEAYVDNYAMAAWMDKTPAGVTNANVTITNDLSDLKVTCADKTVTYNGMAQQGNVATTNLTAEVTYSKEANGTYTTEVPSFIEAGEHTYYYKATRPGYTDVTGSAKLIINKADLAVDATFNVDPDFDTVTVQAVLSGLVDGSFKGTVTVTVGGKSVTFEADKFTYDGDGDAISTESEALTLSKGGVHNVTITYTAANDDNYNSATGTTTVDVDKKSVTADDLAKIKAALETTFTYDGEEKEVVVKGTVDDWTITTDGANLTNVGKKMSTITATNTSGKYADFSFNVMLEVTPKEIAIVIDNAKKALGEADPTFSSNIGNLLVNANDFGDIEYVREPGEAMGEYYITMNYTPNPNYEVKSIAKGILTIGEVADYKVEVADNSLIIGGDYKADYFAGHRLVLVYTNVDKAYFTYNGEPMYDVSDAGYVYYDYDYSAKTAISGGTYKHVYAIVVEAEGEYEATEAHEFKYARNVKFDKDAEKPVKIVYDSDINYTGELDENDFSITNGIYNALYRGDNYITRFLKADAKADKRVDNVGDAAKVKTEVVTNVK